MKPTLSTIITTLLVSCALVVTSLLVKREFFASSEMPEPVYELDQASWILASEQGILLGEETAPVKIVVFYDYECSFCRRSVPVLDVIFRKYTGKVAVVYRHFPLPVHPLARPAAIATECASGQGHFKPYHDELYKRQGALKEESWVSIAQEIDMPEMEEFKQCLESGAVRERLEIDQRLVESLGITSIPTFIVNKKLFVGLLSVAELDAIIQGFLRSSGSG